MKVKILFLLSMLVMNSRGWSQTGNTNTGTGAGNAGSYNTSIGYYAGDKVVGLDNTFIGSYSGYTTAVTGGFRNSFLGSFSGHVNTSGNDNSFIGAYSGRYNTSGDYNTFLGFASGYNNTTGGYNVFIGNETGNNNSTGIYNTFIGYQSGFNATGSSNVFIGRQAGYNETGSDKLYIDNTSTSTPLIYGDFSTDLLTINGSIRGNVSGALRINSGNGYVDVGAQNTSWAHFNTDRPRYYFDKGITVDEGLVGSYDENLCLQTSGTTRLTISNSNGNIGIGTTSPDAKLSVFTTSTNAGDNSAIFYAPSIGASMSHIHYGTTGDWYIRSANATGKVIIQDSGGNVGIGTTAPDQKLHVTGNFVLDGGLIFTGTGASELNRYLQLLNSSGAQSASGLKAGGILVSDSYAYANPGKNDLIVKGNIGIGFTSPTEKLEVAGTAKLTGVTQDNSLTRVLVSDSNGKLFWRDASNLTGTSDNLGNHTATQNILPNTSGSHDLGSGGAQFRNIYLTGSLYRGGVRFLYAVLNNQFLGLQAGNNNSTGDRNYFSGPFAGYSNTTASDNFFIGGYAGYNTTGDQNFFLGYQSGYLNTTGAGNYFAGLTAGYSNTTGSNNYFTGQLAGYSNTTASYNHFVGLYAGQYNTTGDDNYFSGHSAGRYNTTGSGNYFSGLESGKNNTTGVGNFFAGSAGISNTTGSDNSFAGNSSGGNNATGNYNSAFGRFSGPNSSNLANTTALGSNTITTASNQVRIGDSNVTSIGGQVSWSTLSDGRFKQNIKEDVSGLDFINQLRPVSYLVDKQAFERFLGIPDNMKQQPEARTKPVRQTGFVAQEVEKIINKSGYAFAGVEAPQNEKDHYSIRYAEFVVPLVKAVQELDKKTKTLEQFINDQQKLITSLLSTLPENSKEEKTGNKLYQNSPNPFSGGTEITMNISNEVNQAIVYVYDLNGKTVEQVVISARGNGVSVKIEPGKLTSGLYLYSLIVDGKIAGVKRMLLTD